MTIPDTAIGRLELVVQKHGLDSTVAHDISEHLYAQELSDLAYDAERAAELITEALDAVQEWALTTDDDEAEQLEPDVLVAIESMLEALTDLNLNHGIDWPPS